MYSGSGTPAEGTCYSDGNYTLVDVNAASSAVKQNFANWFSYYRTRMYALKTSVGEAFRVVDEAFRVGIHTINNPSSSGTSGGFLTLNTFDQTQRDAFYTVLYRLQPSGNTPLREAQQRIGEYYPHRGESGRQRLAHRSDPVHLPAELPPALDRRPVERERRERHGRIDQLRQDAAEQCGPAERARRAVRHFVQRRLSLAATLSRELVGRVRPTRCPTSPPTTG